MFSSLIVVACLASSRPFLGPPVQWANGFAASPSLPAAGDVDNDGFGDLIAVYPKDGGFIDVCLNSTGTKASPPSRALDGWAGECQAAVAGEFDANPGADVVGVFGGKSVRMAGAYANGRFQDLGQVFDLPRALEAPAATRLFGGMVLIFSTKSGEGWLIEPAKRRAEPLRVPKGTVWVGQSGKTVAGQDEQGNVFTFKPESWTTDKIIGRESKDARPAVIDGAIVFANSCWREGVVQNLDLGVLPAAGAERLATDFDHDGDLDVFEFRHGSEMHSGREVILRVNVGPGETDSDHDGLSNDEEAGIGSDVANPDTDGDGLLDGWEVKGFRGLDLKALDCSPLHTDVICLISRFENVAEATVKSELDRAMRFYSELRTPNPDGSTGFRFHPIYLDPVKGDDMKNAWWVNRDKFRPAKWYGVVHWMQVTQGGGGQADQLGDGGSVAENALWAVFIHEFGHQMGMDHEGFWPSGLCPIYTSLMNYAYSYALEDDYNKIHYSDGQLKGYVLRETDLDETIPLPYEKVKFLEKGPYRFRLKPNGATTLIDWNWNGTFGEKHVRADINYSYSTNAGRRDDGGKTQTAPFLFTMKGHPYLLYGLHDFPADPKTDPSVSPEKPGKLVLKPLVEPFKWGEPFEVEKAGLTGEPTAFALGDSIHCYYQTEQGVVTRAVKATGKTFVASERVVVNPDKSLVPTVGEYKGRPFLFLWNPVTGVVQYSAVDKAGKLGKPQELDAKSVNPVGMCEDTLTGEAIVAMAQNQDDARPNRWQIRRYREADGKLVPTTMDWVDGEKGGSRGTGRLTVLFDSSRDAGKHGRVYIYGKGMTNKDTPWSCTYVAHTIDDKTINGGWMVKRFYDEWTQTRSAPAAAWFGKDVIWAYRWVDGGQGASDNVLHVGYKALGIQDEPMGDHDDLSFFRNWGIRNSILYLSKE